MRAALFAHEKFPCLIKKPIAWNNESSRLPAKNHTSQTLQQLSNTRTRHQALRLTIWINTFSTPFAPPQHPARAWHDKRTPQRKMPANLINFLTELAGI
jgi:hypothetical protein